MRAMGLLLEDSRRRWGRRVMWVDNYLEIQGSGGLTVYLMVELMECYSIGEAMCPIITDKFVNLSPRCFELLLAGQGVEETMCRQWWSVHLMVRRLTWRFVK